MNNKNVTKNVIDNNVEIKIDRSLLEVPTVEIINNNITMDVVVVEVELNNRIVAMMIAQKLDSM